MIEENDSCKSFKAHCNFWNENVITVSKTSLLFFHTHYCALTVSGLHEFGVAIFGCGPGYGGHLWPLNLNGMFGGVGGDVRRGWVILWVGECEKKPKCRMKNSSLSCFGAWKGLQYTFTRLEPAINQQLMTNFKPTIMLVSTITTFKPFGNWFLLLSLVEVVHWLINLYYSWNNQFNDQLEPPINQLATFCLFFCS